MKRKITDMKKIITNTLLIAISVCASACGNSAKDIPSESITETAIDLITSDISDDSLTATENEDLKEENIIGGPCKSYAEYASDDLILNPEYKNIQTAIKAGLEEHMLQGTVLVGVGDEIVYVESFGKASEWDNINNTNTTRYGIASLTKSFTAASIMKLNEEGKLGLNDTIDKYFPEYKYGSNITILELLQMRSGIIDYLNDMDKYMTLSDSKAIYDGFIENKDLKGLDEYKWSREEMLNNMYNNGLRFDPDERYEYCNTNYYLLGCIIEQVTGMTYEDYITENMLDACYMSNSNLSPRDGDAVGYIKNEGFVNSSYETLFSAGAIRSNIFDMFSWMRNLTQCRVISQSSFEKMIDVDDVAVKNQLFYEKEQERLKEEQGDEYEEPEVDPNYVPTYYGCGLMVTGSVVWHRGYIDGFANYMSYDRDTDITIIILTNTSEETATKDLAGLWKDINNAACN